MRLFLALDIPDDDRDALAGLQSGMSGGRQVEPDLFHITIAYLGDGVRDETASDLHDLLGAAPFSRGEIALKGIGHFGHSAPTAIWVGVAPVAPLDALHQRTARLAREAGLDLPRRRYVPHVTLARYSEGDLEAANDLAHLLLRHGSFSRPAFRPIALNLMRSHLGRRGPDYEVLAQYPLR
ncbi:RNA 2',3'-cyclic phosphodiesterase [Alphaproteobacteria bacterium GH1-50]|uniref:RNA 2',3'-cyclic phosphodiesterase n=1 Tax=Kangsaoukella pontilimi TaxID=2691042 RepID=A0A7C9MBE2_9RHOB|nr:RNA 2',3'-cyclic phosphodiesterase [Kangsaoukella pontilimi]MXQ06412.1 RNA 2',3'-cyclic phosphodiesterase [Kangsaoukella pontilimi]